MSTVRPHRLVLWFSKTSYKYFHTLTSYMDVCHSSLAIDCPCTIVQTFLHFLQEFLPLLHLYGQPRRLGDHRCTWKFLLPRLAMVNHFGKHFTKGVQMLNLVDSPYQPSSKHWLLCPILLDSLFDENTIASCFGEVIYLELFNHT